VIDPLVVAVVGLRCCAPRLRVKPTLRIPTQAGAKALGRPRISSFQAKRTSGFPCASQADFWEVAESE
jgi:hypothetical protein